MLFNFAIGLFIISSIAAGLSKTMVYLVIARAFQGIGAGGNLALVYIVLGLALIALIFSGLLPKREMKSDIIS